MRLTSAQAKALGIPLGPSKRPKAASASKAGQEAARKAFLALCAAHGLPEPVPEYRFARQYGREWRADYAWPQHMLLVEQDGGTYGRGKPCPTCGRKRGGAHSSIKDLKRDQEKLNACSILGFAVLRFRPEQINDGSAFPIIKHALEGKEGLP